MYSHWKLLFANTINTQVHEVTKHTLYELVFGQPPRSLTVPDAHFGVQLNDEALETESPEDAIRALE